MGLRGPKSRFGEVSCSNGDCPDYKRRGAGNIKGNGCYPSGSGSIRKFVCHTCGGVFCDRTATAFYDLRTPEERVLLALQLILRGMSIRAVAGALEAKPDTVRFWLTQAAAHADHVNAALVQHVRVTRVELDELWTFVRKKNFRGWQRARRATMAQSGSGSPSPQSTG